MFVRTIKTGERHEIIALGLRGTIIVETIEGDRGRVRLYVDHPTLRLMGRKQEGKSNAEYRPGPSVRRDQSG